MLQLIFILYVNTLSFLLLTSTPIDRIPVEGNGIALQYFHLENPIDRGAWRAPVIGLQSRTRLSTLLLHGHVEICLSLLLIDIMIPL